MTTGDGRGPIAYALASKAVELLGDGEWHNFEETVRELMKLVPPGIAMRRQEKDRINAAKQEGRQVGPRKKLRETSELVASGKRSVVRDFLKNPRLFETDRPGKAGQRDYDRKLRMLREPATLKGHPDRVRRDELLLEVRELKSQRDKVRSWLNTHGLSDVAVELLGPEPQDEEEEY